jgi:hypothetical protein
MIRLHGWVPAALTSPGERTPSVGRGISTPRKRSVSFDCDGPCAEGKCSRNQGVEGHLLRPCARQHIGHPDNRKCGCGHAKGQDRRPPVRVSKFLHFRQLLEAAAGGMVIDALRQSAWVSKGWGYEASHCLSEH